MRRGVQGIDGLRAAQRGAVEEERWCCIRLQFACGERVFFQAMLVAEVASGPFWLLGVETKRGCFGAQHRFVRKIAALA